MTDFNDGSFKPLSSESNTLDGLNVHCSLIDELHAIEDKNLYDVIVDGMSAREQPLSVITTTAGTIREGIYDIKYDECERILKGFEDKSYTDERVLPIIYELDARSEWTDPEMWAKFWVDTSSEKYSFRFEDIPPEALEKQYENSMSQNVQIKIEDGKPVDIIRLDKDLWRLKVDVWRVFIRFKGDLAEILTVERRKTTTYRKR